MGPWLAWRCALVISFPEWLFLRNINNWSLLYGSVFLRFAFSCYGVHSFLSYVFHCPLTRSFLLMQFPSCISLHVVLFLRFARWLVFLFLVFVPLFL